LALNSSTGRCSAIPEIHRYPLPRLQPAAANFGKVACEPAWRWDTRLTPLPDYDLWYVWNGAGTLAVNGSPAAPIGRGMCCLFRPGDRTFALHDQRAPLTVTFVHFSLAADAPPATGLMQPARQRVVADTLLMETYLSRCVAALQDGGAHGMQEAELLLQLMWLHLLREDKAPSERDGSHHSAVHAVAAAVRESPGTVHTLAQLAQLAQLSPRYLSVKFKQVMGETLEHYCVRIRLERAEHLLRHNGMNVSEVAAALGYNDLSFFSRQFKKFRGRSPSELKHRL
jgi:AraC-like DNA-binding protein